MLQQPPSLHTNGSTLLMGAQRGGGGCHALGELMGDNFLFNSHTQAQTGLGLTMYVPITVSDPQACHFSTLQEAAHGVGIQQTHAAQQVSLLFMYIHTYMHTYIKQCHFPPKKNMSSANKKKK